MLRSLKSLWQGIELLALRSYQYHLLSVAAMVLVIAIFFSQGYSPARFVLHFLVLPVSALGLCSPGRRNLRLSYVLLACVVYLVTMLVASAMQPEITLDQLWQQLRSSAYITAFLLIIASLVASYPRFTRYFFLIVGTAVAINILINIYLYFQYVAPFPYRALAQYRLKTLLGMRDYANATNVSATYAVFFMGVIATAVRRDLPSWARRALVFAALVLLVGVLLTQARSALTAVTVGTVLLVLTLSRRTQTVGAVIGLTIAIAMAGVPAIERAVTMRGSSFRFEVWTKFVDLIEAKPVFGYGPWSQAGIKLDSGAFLDQAHNLVLSGWFRGGILAAAAMLFILVGGIYWARRYWRATGNIAPLCVMVTIAIAGMVDYQLLPTDPTWPWVTFWLPIGLAAGAEMAWRNLHTSGQDQASAHATSPPARSIADQPMESV